MLALPQCSLSRTSLNSYQRAAIEAELSAYDIALGACERISRQAAPKAYTRCMGTRVACRGGGNCKRCR